MSLLPDRELSIVHLLDSWGPGGAETVYVDLIRGLDRGRFRSHPLVIAEGWLSEAVRAEGLQPRIVPTEGAFDVGYVVRLARIARETKADVIHSHTLNANVYAALAGFLAGAPVLSTWHGNVDFGEANRFRRAKLAIVRRGSSRIACVSEYLRGQVLEKLGAAPEQVVVVPNGIDTTRYVPGGESGFRAELDMGSDAFLIVAVGNVRPEKGFDLLLRAAPSILARIPTAHFVIVGEEREPTASGLHRLRRALHLEDRVRFVGFRHDITAILAASSVVVISSRSEGFSLVAVQAMASGIPLVATRCGGPEEIITDGEDGLLVEVEDPEAIAAAVGRIGEDRPLRAQLVDRGRKTAVDRFSLQAMVNRYAALYEQLAVPGD